jgi:hypothetical protein
MSFIICVALCAVFYRSAVCYFVGCVVLYIVLLLSPVKPHLYLNQILIIRHYATNRKVAGSIPNEVNF